MMQSPVDDGVLWRFVDAAGDEAELYRPSPDTGEDTLATLVGWGRELVWLTSDAARDLRDALNQLLVEDGGSEETRLRQATLEGAHALHAEQHRQLERAARRSAQHIDEQAGILARIVDVADAGRVVEEVDPAALAGTVHALLDVQRRTVASVGDLLTAIQGEP